MFLSAVWGDDEVAEEYLENEAMLLSYRVLRPRTSIPKATALRELLWGYSKSFRVSKFTDTCLLYGSDETYEPAVETGSSMSLNEP